MLRFILMRILWTLPVIAAILVADFLLIHLVPGDPITAQMGDFPFPPAYVAELRARYGLDQPLVLQLFYYIGNLLRGDLGFSLFNRVPVAEVIAQRAANTLVLMVPVLIFSSLLGIAIGMLAATQRRRSVDLAITGLSLVGKSVPIFWSGQLLIIIFAVNLGWLPAQGMHSVRGAPAGFAGLVDLAAHWLMPGLIATSINMVIVARVARVSFKQTLVQDYVTTATAIGLSRPRVLLRHALPNAFLPVLTVIGHNVGNLLTGTIMVEAVFGWPGLGGLFLNSISARDYPVLQGLFLLTALITIGANLLTDILYALIDPRVRSSYVSAKRAHASRA